VQISAKAVHPNYLFFAPSLVSMINQYVFRS
jgi:hypothetical protein